MIGIKIIVALVLGFLVFSGNSVLKQPQKKEIQKQGDVTNAKKISPSPVQVNVNNNQKDISPTKVPVQNQPAADNSWIYPNSQIISSLGNEFVLKTRDDSQITTNWYKNKIKQAGFDALSVAQTNSNGNVSNKLSGSIGQKEVNIEINKAGESEMTEIRVFLKLTIDN